MSNVKKKKNPQRNKQTKSGHFFHIGCNFLEGRDWFTLTIVSPESSTLSFIIHTCNMCSVF